MPTATGAQRLPSTNRQLKFVYKPQTKQSDPKLKSFYFQKVLENGKKEEETLKHTVRSTSFASFKVL